jgi:hypothetical protein
MGTRCNIVIEYGASRVYLYRHWDGYLAETGADLARKLQESGAKGGESPTQFLQSLLDERYDKQSYEDKAKRLYEITDSIHGDIEYLYRVRFATAWSTTARVSTREIGYRTCAIGSERPEDVSGVHLGPLETFVNAVNRDIKAQNVRLAQMRKEQPGPYGDAVDTPEVVLA